MDWRWGGAEGYCMVIVTIMIAWVMDRAEWIPWDWRRWPKLPWVCDVAQ